MARKLVTRDDIIRLFGQVEDRAIAEILALRPTLDQLEEAALWLIAEDDVMGERRAPLAGVAAQLYEILSREEELPEEPRLSH
jgi:hypothetical protein